MQRVRQHVAAEQRSQVAAAAGAMNKFPRKTTQDPSSGGGCHTTANGIVNSVPDQWQCSDPHRAGSKHGAALTFSCFASKDSSCCYVTNQFLSSVNTWELVWHGESPVVCYMCEITTIVWTLSAVYLCKQLQRLSLPSGTVSYHGYRNALKLYNNQCEVFG